VPAESKPKNGDKVRPSEDALRAELAMSAPLTGAALALTFSTRTVGELDLAESVSVLTAKVAAVQGGDLRRSRSDPHRASAGAERDLHGDGGLCRAEYEA
jgi:hypothetical protein